MLWPDVRCYPESDRNSDRPCGCRPDEKSISNKSTFVCHTFSDLLFIPLSAEPSPETANGTVASTDINASHPNPSWIALLAALAVYLNFGTLSPCGVLREASRQRDSLAAVLPDSIVDLSLAGQFGELSPGRCLAVLIGEPTLNNVQTSVPQTAQPVVPQTRNRRRYHQ